MALRPWEDLARGIDCPYDGTLPTTTEYFDLVAKLSISSLCLTKNQAYRGSCTLIFDARHATRIGELSATEWASFSDDLFRAEASIVRALRPDHVNLALLGNTIPHLHWGIIPRYRNDPKWGASIWTGSGSEKVDFKLKVPERRALIALLQQELSV